jgi:two-component sensor histidine kinase
MFGCPPRFSFSLTGDGVFRLISFWAVASLVIFLTAFVHAVLDQLALAEQRAATIARAMQHRVQNTLTIVQAIANQTFRAADTLGGAQEALSGRLAALGRAHHLIDEGIDGNVALASLINTALSPFDGGQFVLSGPSLIIEKDVGVSFVLLLHELATNAAKYGALSIDAGRVEITWLEDSPQQGRLIWKEQCGPEVVPPSRTGFGSKLLRAAFPQAEASIAFEPDGVRCTITFPIQNHRVQADTSPAGTKPYLLLR